MVLPGPITTPFTQQNAQAMNPVVSRLFKSIGNQQPVTTNQTIRKGSLITFGYSMWKHDSYPLLLVSNIIPGQKVFGVNMHYLTFPYIKNILRMGANNPGFSYQNIKADQYIVNAFRSYKWAGIRQVKILDAAFLLSVMASVRSFDPTQVAAIRKSVQQQIMRETNPPAKAGEVYNGVQQG